MMQEGDVVEENKEVLLKKARQMILDGDDYEKITRETGLRLKDLKRIQREIESHF